MFSIFKYIATNEQKMKSSSTYYNNICQNFLFVVATGNEKPE